MRAIALVLSMTAVLFVAATSFAAAGQQRAFAVRSTLTGKTVLPHRIHWLGIPNLPPGKVAEVDFLIDGKICWVEHHAPYTYGFDGNYLVTSWLTPGSHTFVVRATSTAHQHASTSTTARVLPAPSPPAVLAGTWRRTLTKAESKGSGPAGVWRLTINKIGWQFRDPRGGGALVDVAYLSSGTLEARGGIATKDRSPLEGNPWCDEPFQPVRYRWTATSSSLKLTLAGPKRCDGQSNIWAGNWTRAS